MEAREGRDAQRLDATHDSAARRCRETQRQFRQERRTTQCEASGIYRPVPFAGDGEHLQPSSGRVATAAAARQDGTDGRAAAWLAWPPSAVLCAFIVEGALRPLADSAGQALSRFMPSASIHKARFILTFWSMP
jgi:hypothetical protein